MSKKRVGVYLTPQLNAELDYYVRKYQVKPSYVLQLAYKLTDRRALEKILELGVASDD